MAHTNKINEPKKSIEQETLPETIMIGAVAVFVFALFALYPLYFQEKYANMGNAKYDFFKTAYTIFIPVMMLSCVCYFFLKRKELSIKTICREMVATDWFVLAYFIVCWISYGLSDYKGTAFWGYDGWFMGVMTQTVFVLLYFFVSRWFLWHWSYWWFIAVPSAIVFLLGILHRFNVDPLGMYEGLDENIKILFLSTLGQATWYSSYLCIALPIGMACYWYRRGLKWSTLWGVFLVIAFASVVTQNSDSAFMALGGSFLVFFWLSFESNEYFVRFWELVIMCLASFKAIGALQGIFSERAIKLEGLSTFCSQSMVTLILLVIAIAVYVGVFLTDRKGKLHIERFCKARNVLYVLMPVGIAAVVICIYLVSTGKVSGTFLDRIGYFKFDDHWGNNRGFTWKFTARMYGDYGFKEKLFGCGPDAYAGAAYAYDSGSLQAFWGNSVLACAHNEWLNCLVDMGILGLITYFGIFVTAFLDFLKKWKQHPFMVGAIAVIVAYFLHNFFCYQQIICTPIIFVVMGIGTSLCHRKDEYT
jgi:O-antigen ligase